MYLFPLVVLYTLKKAKNENIISPTAAQTYLVKGYIRVKKSSIGPDEKC